MIRESPRNLSQFNSYTCMSFSSVRKEVSLITLQYRVGDKTCKSTQKCVRTNDTYRVTKKYVKYANCGLLRMRQLVILRMVFDAPCYVDNKTLNDSSGTPYVKDEINRLSANYLHRIKDHTNHYVRQLQTPAPPLPEQTTQEMDH